MKKSIQLVSFVSLVCLVCSFVRAEEKLATMSYNRTITPSQGETITSKVWIKGNNMRMEQIAEGEKMITLMKEGIMYLYYPTQKMAMKMDISAGTGRGGQENPKDMMEYLKSIKAKPLGQEKIEGKLCNVYQITYSQTGLPAEASAKAGAKGKVWVWKEKNFPLKSVMTMGSEVITTRYRNVQMDISMPDSYFELPPGTQITDISQIMPGVIPQE
jgi:outer membrane lipoprotein-sorting protein